ncbi:hypothetical protein C6A85_71060, partial [Mycobacterium sp. ITM-2017-0098]
MSYTPNADFDGTDTFTYSLNGGAAATVAITVTAVNDAPIAANDSYTVLEDGVLVITAPGLLANDSDPEHPFIYITTITDPSHGSLA